MKNWLTVFAFAAILVAGFAHADTTGRAVVADAQSDAAVAKQFHGMWRLVSSTQRLADGTTRPSQNDTGYLVYTDVNRMCAVLLDSKRPKWAPGPPKTVQDAVSRSTGFTSYCGRVEVNAKEGFVLHHVDADRNPSIIGTIRKRWFSFQGPNRLTLRVDAAELGATVTESTLVWERIQN